MAAHELIKLSVEPFGAPGVGADFGYDLVRARADVRLDPDSAANAAVTDIGRARRDAEGRVPIVSDVLILRPRKSAQGNGGLLVVVPNRGTTGGLPFNLGRTSMGGVGDGLDPGDGWILRQGWSIAWVGWQWDIATGGSLLGCDTPDVLDERGQPLRGTVRVRLQPGKTALPVRLNTAGDLRRSSTRFYRAADMHDPHAEVRIGPDSAERSSIIPRDAWRFARRDEAGRLVPDAEHLWLKEGYAAGTAYEASYTTEVCPLVGAGLAAVRDVASFLRYDDGTPGVRYAVAVGWSQSGRFLRQLLRAGLTHDEQGRAAFDGVIPFIAGASGGEFNQRYGQPAEGPGRGLGQLGPFDLDGLLAHGRRLGPPPKVMLVNTASEYWRADASLVHISLDGDRDLPPSPRGRCYALAGVEHVGGAEVPGVIANRNWLSPTPVYRALLEAMRQWIVDGREPPADRLPRRDKGTAVTRQRVLDRFMALGIAPIPPLERLAVRRDADAGPLAETGILSRPLRLGAPYPAYVSDVDADGNEIAGVRLPAVAAPLATHAGWTTLLAGGPQWDGLAVLVGDSHPFASTTEARGDARDPRPSIAERYSSRDDYARKVRSAANQLCAEGFMLAEDIDAVVAEAVGRYEGLA